MTFKIGARLRSVFASFCVHGIAVVAAAPMNAGEERISLEEFKESCGQHSAYLAARLCGKSLEWEMVRRELPITRGKGVSLAELRSFFDRIGLQTKLAWVKDEDIIKSNKCVFIVHEPAVDGGLSHFFVARAIRSGTVQKLDFPNDPVDEPVIINERRAALVVASDASALPVIRTNVSLMAIIVFAVGGALFLGSMVAVRRRSGLKKHHAAQAEGSSEASLKA